MENLEENGMTPWRVKVYQLEPEGAWTDKGTGFVSCRRATETEGPKLIVMDEFKEGEIMLQSKIQPDDSYEQQGGTSGVFIRMLSCCISWFATVCSLTNIV